MQRVASIARLSAAVISMLYFVMLLPHGGSITLVHFTSPWFLGAATLALAWIPLFWFHHDFERSSGVLHVALSFAPLLMFATFFGFLYFYA